MKGPNWQPSLGLCLDFITHQLEVRQNSYLTQFGITSSQAKVLLFLLVHEQQAIFQKDLETVFSMRSSTITSIMGYLEKGGFVVRTPCSQDGRAKRIAITEKGKALRGIIDAMLIEQEQQLCETLTPEESIMLKSLLKKVATTCFPHPHTHNASHEHNHRKACQKEGTICSNN